MGPTDLALARAEHAEAQLRRQAMAQAVLRGAARTLIAKCECAGLGKVRRQRGFFTTEVECTACLPLREALATGEIV